MEYLGQILCEDCYMDVLSPAKPCDPWAVYTAKSFSLKESALTKLQEEILKILQETGGVEPDVLAEKLNLKLSALQREIATLRHMEKLRATMKDGKKVICLW
jgi:predicted transcriptional regulator